MRCALFQRLLPAVLCLGVCVSLQVGCPRPSDSIDSKQGAPGNGQAEARGGDAPDRDEDNSTTAGNDRGGGSSARNAVVSDKPVEFDEPAGITYAGGMLYVADTNNHEIRTIDLDNGYRVSTFVIDGLEPPRVPPEPPANSDKREAEAGPSIVEEAPASDPPRSDPRTAEPRPPTPPEKAISGAGNDEPHSSQDPRSVAPRPPAPPGEERADEDADRLDPDFPFRAKFAWEELGAPLPQDADKWLNTDRPLRVSDFEGKFVMLDFWTYCCINCIHILPELKKLERAYPNQLVVIGVHSAKFDTEEETENVKEAVLRYEIEHPVVNDVGSTVWKTLGVNSWPTVMLIDPQGHLVFMRKGEWAFEEMDEVLRKALPYYRKKGLLKEKPVKFPLLKDQQAPKPLNFPGKVLADEASNRLFIADSNNNRIVVSSLDGDLLDVIGTGAIGRDDGPCDEATFNKPQGMALLNDTLYVADTENHLIRKIDLKANRVTTIAGTGKQGRNAWPGLDRFHAFAEPPERFVADPKEFAISSPWALYIHEGDLFIAMAGPHQIWKMTLDEKEIGPYAGNGREDIVDGPLLPEYPYEEGYASFAQPSGLASDGAWLYVADSEGSSIRAVPFDPEKNVKTIIGTAKLPFNRLFIFGHRDGKGLLRLGVPDFEWRGRVEQTIGPALQHCLGVVHHEGVLYVADTYNNAIKMIDLDEKACTTIAGELPEQPETPSNGGAGRPSS